MTDEEVLRVASECGWNVEHQATNDYIIKFARALMAEKVEPETVMAEYTFQTYAAYKTDGEMKIGVIPEPQTTHWEGCEAVHPECRKAEPVAWTTGWHGGHCVVRAADPAAILPIGVALYTAPTPRKWVSLTEQEMYDLFFNDQYGPRLPEYLVNTIKCVEAALKEKNT